VVRGGEHDDADQGEEVTGEPVTDAGLIPRPDRAHRKRRAGYAGADEHEQEKCFWMSSLIVCIAFMAPG
jgi:hypothetical protein